MFFGYLIKTLHMIRRSPIAGSWYSSNPDQLQKDIQSLFLDSVYGPGQDPKTSELPICNDKLVGLGVPHAGYYFSGVVAAHSYLHLFSHYRKIDVAIVLGPNHRVGYPSISIYPSGSWELPCGNIEIDEDLLQFAEDYSDQQFQNLIQFESESQAFEHSIEMQLPFLQFLYGNDFAFLPICYGDQSFNPVANVMSKFLKSIFEEFSHKTIVMLASSDLSHEPDIKRLERIDKMMLQLLISNKLEEAVKFRKEEKMTMCGYGPIFTLARLTQLMGSPKNKLLAYAHSEQIRPNHGGAYAVGYPALAFEV